MLWTRRQLGPLLTGAALAVSASKGEAQRKHGIIRVTRNPRIGLPAHVPAGKVWNYTIAFPFQAAPGVAGAVVDVKPSFGPGQDYANGTDILIFSDRLKIDTRKAVTITRNELAPNPNDGDRMAELVKYPNPCGFVPLGAKRSDGLPHPHAGTGFVTAGASAWTLKEEDPGPRVGDHPMNRRHIMSNAKFYSRWEFYQLSYDGQELKISGRENVEFGDVLPGWTISMAGMTTAIPDGDDLLLPICGGRPGRPRGAGIMRWRRTGGKWRPADFQLITGADGASHEAELLGPSHSLVAEGSIEPSLIRDLDGEFMFAARGRNASGHPMRAWKSSNHGADWKMVLFVGGISSSPVTLNKAADGTPYIAANRYQYQTRYKNTPSIPFFIGPDGRPRPDGGTRETLMAWPLNDERNAVEIPVMIRDGLQEFGPPPHDTLWEIDHPSGGTVQLGDGQWHHLLGYRVIEKEENVAFVSPTPYTGCYIEEVISGGKPIPAWNF